MPVLEEPEDPFLKWCHERNYYDEEAQRAHFGEWVEETTGYDGKAFSLTEEERHWVFRAKEILDWLRIYALANQPEALEAALRCLPGLADPKSLFVE